MWLAASVTQFVDLVIVAVRIHGYSPRSKILGVDSGNRFDLPCKPYLYPQFFTGLNSTTLVFR
jgi:hypothetical protein